MKLVSIYRGVRAEAEAIAGVLRSNGVEVLLSADDAGGWRPDVGFAQGTRILVAAADEELARRLIAEVEPLPEG